MNRDRAVVVTWLGAAAAIVHSRRLAPRIVAIAGPFARIVDCISMADQRDVAVVLEIIGIGVALLPRVETQKRELGEEQFRAVPLSDLQLVTIIAVAIDEMVTIGGAAPVLAVLDRPRRGARPATMPQTGWDR